MNLQLSIVDVQVFLDLAVRIEIADGQEEVGHHYHVRDAEPQEKMLDRVDRDLLKEDHKRSKLNHEDNSRPEVKLIQT